MKRIVLGAVLSFVLVASLFAVAPVAHAQSEAELQKQIADLLKQIQSLQGQLGQSGSGPVASSSSVCPNTWTRNLTFGSVGEDVRKLQQFLNDDPDTRVATTGVGSAGSETTFYGSLLTSAVTRFQEKYASSVLTPIGLTQGTGGFYTRTRDHANSLCSTTVERSGSRRSIDTESVTPSADSVRVTEGNHPTNGIAVQGALRVPFTVFSLTAPRSGSVRINGVKVRRVGLSDDDSFNGLVLLDEDGLQIGNDRRLNSRSEATVGGRLDIRRGETRTFVVAANITTPTGNDNIGGEIAAFEVIDIVTDADVDGRLPIRGASHTLNDTIELPTLDVSENSGDSGEHEIGDEVTALSLDLSPDGSNRDDIRLHSLTFEQSGSANSNDIDVTVRIDDEDYTPVITEDRYTVTIDGGLLIDDNDEVRVEVLADIENGNDRNIRFEVYENTDIYATSRKYGYGVPLSDGGSGVDLTRSPIVAGDTITISGGSGGSDDLSLRGDDRRPIIEDNDALLGRFELEVDGEPIDFQDIQFSVALTSAADNDDNRVIEDLTLWYDDRRVADSDDIEFDSVDSNAQTVTGEEFDLREDLEEGEHEFEIRGTLNEYFKEGDRVQFTITGFGRLRGVTTGDRYGAHDFLGGTSSAPGTLELDRVTANAGEFAVSFFNLSARTIVKGSNNVEVARIRFDASDSNNNIRVRDIDLTFENTIDASGRDTDNVGIFDNCALFDEDDDEVSRNDHSPSGSDSDTVQFNFDRDYEVEEDTVELISVICDIDNDAVSADTYRIAATANGQVTYETLGASRRTRTLAFASGNGPTLTIAGSGTLEVDIQDGTTRIVPVGDDGERVRVGSIEFEADDENIVLESVYLTVTTGTANVSDVVSDIYFVEKDKEDVSANRLTTRTISDTDTSQEVELKPNIEIDDDQTKVLDVYVNLKGISDESSGTGRPADSVEVTVDWDTTMVGSPAAPRETDANVIVASGEERLGGAGISGITDGESVGKIYTHRSVPTFTQRDVSGRLDSSTEWIYEFTVQADNEGPISLNKLTFDVRGSTGVTLMSSASLRLYAYDSSTGRSNPISLGSGASSRTDGTVSAGISSFTFGNNKAITFVEPLKINAGETVYFALRLSGIDAIPDNTSITTFLQGDSGDPTTGSVVAGSVSGNIVWSPHSESSNVDTSDADWFEGERLLGGDAELEQDSLSQN